jgi:hypothetical protein
MNWVLVAGIIAIIGVIFAVFFIKRMFIFLINSIIGLLALMGWNILFPGVAVTINLWSVLLVALFGIVGLIVVVGLHLLGIAF